MIYLGGKWPAKYRNQIFMNNIHGARINQDLLIQQGSGYVGDRAPDFLLANDSWSQILNLRYGPDGQVYMIDWYDMQQCHRRDAKLHEEVNGFDPICFVDAFRIEQVFRNFFENSLAMTRPLVNGDKSTNSSPTRSTVAWVCV